VRFETDDRNGMREHVEPRYWPYLDRFPLYAALVAPVCNDGKVLGAFSVSRHTPGRAFDRHDEDFARDLADRIGLAIANARLYRAARDELARREVVEADLRASEERYRRLA
jgi:GAF domain-containing protein